MAPWHRGVSGKSIRQEDRFGFPESIFPNIWKGQDEEVVCVRERRSSAPTTTIYQRRLDSVTRPVLPSLFIIVVTFLLTGVISPVGKEGFVFAFAVDTVFYWTIFRPASMDATAVFLIGLVLETINFSPRERCSSPSSSCMESRKCGAMG